MSEDHSIPETSEREDVVEPQASTPSLPFAFTHPLLKGAVISARPSEGKVVRKKMYEAGEAHFRSAAPHAARNGWAVYPQTRDSKRRPWLIDGTGIKIQPFQEEAPAPELVDYWAEKAPSANVACIAGPGSNGLIGIDIDIGDPLFSERVQRLAAQCLGETPFRRQGRAPRMMLLYRIPIEDFASSEDMVRSSSLTFAREERDEDGKLVPSEDQIEILSKGKSITIYGSHHKTGDYFKWADKAPSFASTQLLPLVRRQDIDTFLERLSEMRPFVNARKSGGISDSIADFVFDENSKARVPRKKFRNDNAEWVEDASGLVVDGREKYLLTLTQQIIALNEPLHSLFKPGKDAEGNVVREPKTPQEIQADDSTLLSQIITQFKANALMTGNWNDRYLKEEVLDKYRRMSGSFRSGSRRYFRKDAKAPLQTAPSRDTKGPDDFGFIASGLTEGRRALAVRFRDDPEQVPSIPGPDSKEVQAAERARRISEMERKKAERALIPDRTKIAAEVQDRITAALDAFFKDVYPENGEGGLVAPDGSERVERVAGSRIHVLRAPTGAGKTSRTISYIATDPRTKKYDHLIDSGTETVETKSPGPILFLLPTYNNIDELRERAEFLNLDKDLSDEDLGRQAAERGLIAFEDVEMRLADLRRNASSAGLRSMIYKGKAAAGCKMLEKLDLLMGAGISTAGLCRAEVRDSSGETEEKFCVHYHECPAILQKKEIAKSHVVFLAHAFMTLNVPEELKTVRAVVADERIFHLFVHTTTFPIQTFDKGRKPPTLTKKEREALKEGKGDDAQHIMGLRDRAVKEAKEALLRRECPAAALAAYSELEEDGVTRTTGLELVQAAKRVCGGSLPDSSNITPDIDLKSLKDLCDEPAGERVSEEWRFWKIVEERILLLREDTTGTAALARELGRDWPRMAKGDREMRIQYILESQQVSDVEVVRNELVRISWRDTPNWKDAPLLLLDASAEPSIIRKIFMSRVPKKGGNGFTIVEREVVEHDVPAPLNVRTIAVVDQTYANSKILYRGNDYRDRAKSIKLLHNMRNLLSSVSAWYGWGRVVAGANTIVRKALCTDFFVPSNVDFCHFGAMRGLDFAKNHVAAVSFGRMEIPVGTIDGLVAALTYDDDEPEQPFDRLGNGDDPDNPGHALRVPMVPQVLPMRSGLDVEIDVPVYPGRWAQMVQIQYREEELRQFVGRLRPVYREGEAPVWIAMSRVIPSGVVVDEVVSLPDLVMRGKGGKRYIRLWQAIRKVDGVVHPTLLLETSPSEYRNVDDVLTDMRRYGFDPETGVIDPMKRCAWGFTPVRIKSPDQRVSYAFVRTDIRDPQGHLAAIMERYLDWNFDEYDYEVQSPIKPRVAGRVRDADKVENELGTREERGIRESIGIQSITGEVALRYDSTAFQGLSKHNKDLPPDLPITIRIPHTGGTESPIEMTIDELNTDRHVQLMDQRMGRARITEFSPAIMDPKQDYSHLSDNVMDDI